MRRGFRRCETIARRGALGAVLWFSATALSFAVGGCTTTRRDQARQLRANLCRENDHVHFDEPPTARRGGFPEPMPAGGVEPEHRAARR